MTSHKPRERAEDRELSPIEKRDEELAVQEYEAWLTPQSLDKGAMSRMPSQRRLEILNSISRTFASTMRASMIERKRFSRERERLLDRERAARVEAEASQRSLHEALESIGDAFSALDENWRYTYVNERAVEYAGRSRRDLIGRHLWNVYPELAEGKSYAELRRASDKQTVSQVELYSERLGRCLQHRAFPSPMGVSIYTRDITEQRVAEEALRRSEERYRSLATTTSAIVFTATGDGHLTIEAPGWQEFTGQEPSEYAGLGWLKAIHPGDRERIAEEWARAVADGKPVELSYRLCHHSGHYRHVLVRGVPLLEDDGIQVREWIGTVTDVHDRRLAREEREQFMAREWKARSAAEERSRISRELHDRVAHSMAVAYQSLQIHEAIKDRDPQSAAARMKIAQQTTREALNTTRDLSMELRRTEVAEGLSSALSNLLRTALPPSMKSEVSVKGDESAVPPEVREPLFVILREAIRNAVRHSGASHVSVGVAVLRNVVVGTVKDAGCGFDPDGGSNNGIRSMRERVALLKGRLDIQSSDGEGAAVRVEIPFGPSIDEPLKAAGDNW